MNGDLLKNILKELNERISILEGKSEAERKGIVHSNDISNEIDKAKGKSKGLDNKIDNIS